LIEISPVSDIIIIVVVHNKTARYIEFFTEVFIMANEKVIAGLQTIVTDLAQQAVGHQIQSRIFASEGFTKLAEKYAEHAEEERVYVEKCIDRLLDLGCDVKLEQRRKLPSARIPSSGLSTTCRYQRTVLHGSRISLRPQERTTRHLIF
jgi:bacterioferritin (cytochrome b1)